MNGAPDPTAMLSFRSLNEQVAAALTQERLVATLAGFFGILGLLLPARRASRIDPMRVLRNS